MYLRFSIFYANLVPLMVLGIAFAGGSKENSDSASIHSDKYNESFYSAKSDLESIEETAIDDIEIKQKQVTELEAHLSVKITSLHDAEKNIVSNSLKNVQSINTLHLQELASAIACSPSRHSPQASLPNQEINNLKKEIAQLLQVISEVKKEVFQQKEQYETLKEKSDDFASEISKLKEDTDAENTKAWDKLNNIKKSFAISGKNEFTRKINVYFTLSTKKIDHASDMVDNFAEALSGAASTLPSIGNVAGPAAKKVITSVRDVGRNFRVQNVSNSVSDDELPILSRQLFLELSDRLYESNQGSKEKEFESLGTDFAYIAYHYISSGQLIPYLNYLNQRNYSRNEKAHKIGKHLADVVVNYIVNSDERKKLHLKNSAKIVTNSAPFLKPNQPPVRAIRTLASTSDIQRLILDKKQPFFLKTSSGKYFSTLPIFNGCSLQNHPDHFVAAGPSLDKFHIIDSSGRNLNADSHTGSLNFTVQKETSFRLRAVGNSTYKVLVNDIGHNAALGQGADLWFDVHAAKWTDNNPLIFNIETFGEP